MRKGALMLLVMSIAMVLGSGVALAATFTCNTTDCLGSPNADNIRGNDARNVIDARRGDDTVNGNGGNDELYGNVDDDVLRGGMGIDEIYGGSGNDRVFGDSNTDYVFGGSGNDMVIGGPGVDEISGGPGNDRINSEDGVAEPVDCGLGVDTAIIDGTRANPVDSFFQCENVF